MSEVEAEIVPGRFTVADYHRMADAGVFEHRRVELLDGVISEMAPLGRRHWMRHATVVTYLVRTVGDRALIAGQASFPLDDRNEPQPDIAILVPGRYDARPEYPRADEMLAFIEIADSSLARDAGYKQRLYARARIADYLLVDVAHDRVRHFSEPKNLGYAVERDLGPGDMIIIAGLPDVPLAVAAFLATG